MNEGNIDSKQSGNLIEISSDETKKSMEETINVIDNLLHSEVKTELSSSKDLNELMSDDFQLPSFMPSQLLLDEISTTTNNTVFEEKVDSKVVAGNLNNESKATSSIKSKNSILDIFNRSNAKDEIKNQKMLNNTNQNNIKKQIHSKKDMSSWFELFAELDPLSNPDAIANKITGGKDNNQAA